MKKTNRTHLTEEVKNALIDLKDRTKGNYRALNFQRGGYAEMGYGSVRRILMNSTLDIKFICAFLLMCETDTVEMDNIRITIEGDDHQSLEEATFNLKQDIASHKPADIAWRHLALEYGYEPDSGSFARAIHARRWAPVEMIYLLCKRFGIEQAEGRVGGMVVRIWVK